MLVENDVSKTFWREDVNTVVYTMNRVQVRKDANKKPYELWFLHSPIVKYLEFLVVSVISKEMMILVSLMLEVMKVCFLVIH